MARKPECRFCKAKVIWARDESRRPYKTVAISEVEPGTGDIHLIPPLFSGQYILMVPGAGTRFRRHAHVCPYWRAQRRRLRERKKR